MPGLGDIADESIITFPEGLPGLDDCKRFVILRPEGLEPILLFQYVEDENPSLPVIPVKAVKGDYQLQMSSSDRELLGFPDAPGASEKTPFEAEKTQGLPENALCLAVLVLPGEDLSPNCNLFAPIVVNVTTRRAKQVLQLDSDYPTAFPLPRE